MISSLFETLESRRLLSTYYVSAHGNDARGGTSPAAAWRSIDRVNQQVLKPGDMVLFEAGKTFSGSIYVPSTEGGTASNSVIFSSYGRANSRRATIASGSKAGIDIAQTAGVAITNLNFTGGSGNHWPGIWVHTDRSNKKLVGLHIRNVEVKNYGREGIKIDMAGSNSSLSRVKIQNVSLHHNLYGGLKATADEHNSNKQWFVESVRAHDNPGTMSEDGVSGSGIFIADAEDVVVRNCVAFNNGKNGRAPVGIWAAGSNRVVFEHNESYNNRTNTISDGGGFDFDWDTHNSVMQYNYSHGNDGPGFLIYAGSHHSSGNIIRYNVSENDGRKNGKAGIQLGGNVTSTDVHNNVVYITPPPGGHSQSAAFSAHDWGANGKVSKNILVRNNIFYTTGGVKVVGLTENVAQNGTLKFNGNAYYTRGGSFRIQWGSRGYDSLGEWRSGKGQEKFNGVSTGFQGDPRLKAPGQAGTIGDPMVLTQRMRPYSLTPTSPVINMGVPRLAFLSARAKIPHDFFGGMGLKGPKIDIGIDEIR